MNSQSIPTYNRIVIRIVGIILFILGLFAYKKKLITNEILYTSGYVVINCRL